MTECINIAAGMNGRRIERGRVCVCECVELNGKQKSIFIINIYFYFLLVFFCFVFLLHSFHSSWVVDSFWVFLEFALSTRCVFTSKICFFIIFFFFFIILYSFPFQDGWCGQLTFNGKKTVQYRHELRTCVRIIYTPWERNSFEFLF